MPGFRPRLTRPQRAARGPSPPAHAPGLRAQLSELFRLSIPIIIANFSYALLGVTDTIMSGMAGKADLGGVAIGNAFYVPAFVFLQGMVGAMQPLIGRHRGAGALSAIPHTHLVTLLSVLCLAAVMMTILALITALAPEFGEPEMDAIARGYLLYIIFCIPFMGLFFTLKAYCEAMAHPRATLFFGLVSLLLNIPLNYIFIFGALGVPAMGGVGCGTATLVAVVITTLGFGAYILAHPQLRPYSLFAVTRGAGGAEVRDYLRLSLPLGLSASVEASCFTLIAMLLAPFGSLVVASHSIVMSIASFLYTIPLSIGIAVSIMVGYAIGERHAGHLRDTIRAAYHAAFINTALSMLIIGVGNLELVRIYTADEEVVAYAALLLAVAFCNLPVENLQTVQAFVLRGFKDNRYIFTVTVAAFYVVSLLLGTLLSYELLPLPPGLSEVLAGAPGFWIGLFLGLATAAICYRVRLRRHLRTVAAGSFEVA